MLLPFRITALTNALLLSAVIVILLGCAGAPPTPGYAPTPGADSATASPLPTVSANGVITTPIVTATPLMPTGGTPTAVPTSAPTKSPTPTPTPVATPTSAAVSLPAPTTTPVDSASAPHAPVSAALAPTPGARASTHLLREEAKDIQLADSQGLAKNGEAIQLVKQADGTYVANGVLISAQHVAEFPFNNAVLSWNAEAPSGTRLEFQLRVGSGGAMSPWFTMGTWSSTGGASAGSQSSSWGSVDVDTLKLANKATALQYRVVFTTSDPTSSPRLRSVAVVYSDMSAALTGPKPALASGWVRDLPVPQYSQLAQDASVAWDICSPTSLTMVLNFWGKGKSVRDVYQGVRDGRTGIFGNWPLNAAYAGSLGFDAYVDRFYSVEQLQNEIAQGRPVIISIRFGPGELDNSPINSTTGHLIVVRGFTPQGDFIVNDPVAPSSGGVRRIYKRDQLAKIWQDSGGVVYIVRPR